MTSCTLAKFYRGFVRIITSIFRIEDSNSLNILAALFSETSINFYHDTVRFKEQEFLLQRDKSEISLALNRLTWIIWWAH